MKSRRVDVDPRLLVTFWHVAHADSIQQVADSRLLAYGVTRAALSEQLRKLNDDLDVEVWKDGAITAEGAELLPVLDRTLPDLAANIDAWRDRHRPKLLVGGATAFTRVYLPRIARRLAAAEPGCTVSSANGTETDLIDRLRRGELHLIIVPLHHTFPPDLRQKRLLSLTLALLVPRASDIHAAEQLKQQKQIPWRVALPETSPTLIRELQRHLRRLGLQVDQVVTCSLADVPSYVAGGDHLGLSLMEPTLVTHPDVRAIPLRKWPAIEIGVVWRPTGSGRERRVIALLEEEARQLRDELRRQGAAVAA